MEQVCSPLETINKYGSVNLMKSVNTSFVIGRIYLSCTQLLGSGAFGNVYLGRNIETQEYAAVKVIDMEKREHDIRCESEMMKYTCQSGHPNIVQFLECSIISRHAFISMEYCSGGDLFDFVYQDRYLLVDEIKSISVQMSRALVFLSDINIVHRDIKLENILLSYAISDPKSNYLWNHTLKLCDFGVSQYCKSDNFLKGICGTTGYMAPEVLLDIPYGKSADMFSMGVLLYVCATKLMPFGDTTDMFEMMKRIDDGAQLDLLMDLDLLLGELVRNLLHLIPQKRLTAVEYLYCDFNTLHYHYY